MFKVNNIYWSSVCNSSLVNLGCLLSIRIFLSLQIQIIFFIYLFIFTKCLSPNCFIILLYFLYGFSKIIIIYYLNFNKSYWYSLNSFTSSLIFFTTEFNKIVSKTVSRNVNTAYLFSIWLHHFIFFTVMPASLLFISSFRIKNFTLPKNWKSLML